MNWFAKIFDLGVIYKDGRVINHRSLLKVFLNPILRCFGLCIVSNMVPETGEFSGFGVVLMKQDRMFFHGELKCDWEHDYIEKRRIFI